jgi:hypothetical protein
MEIMMSKYLRTNLFVILLVLTFLLLAACSTAGDTPTVEQRAPEAASTEVPATEVAPTEAPPTEPAPTEAEPTESTAAESGGSPAAAVQMECTLVSDQPDVPAELVTIFGVTEDDWVKGPETAALTIVEYSDFQ